MAPSFDITVTLPSTVAYFGLENAISALSPLFGVTSHKSFYVDLGGVTFVSPAGMALLRCAIRRAQDLGYFGSDSRVRLPRAPGVKRYIRRMDVFDGLLQFQSAEDFGRRDPSGFVPMEDFWDEDQAGMAAVRIVDSFGLKDPAVNTPLQCHLCEITENVIYHSKVEHGFAVAQKWSNGIIEFAIADHGIGIIESIKRNPRHASVDDPSAVGIALELGGTGVDSKRRGTGLWKVSQAVERNGGYMRIRTGSVIYSQEGSKRSFSRTRLPLPGTLVAMRFDLGASLDINDILESVPQDDYGFISFED